MLKFISGLIITIIIILIITVQLHDNDNYNLKYEKLKQEYAVKPIPSVNHSLLEPLQKEFKTPQEVTEACMSCHTETHKEVMKSAHWNWERISHVEGRGVAGIGKKNVLNNFCIGAKTNEKSCAKCHIGFGMTDDNTFDFNNASNVDCMVCHDNSNEYRKGSSMAGYPDRSVNLKNVAQSVGTPEKINCGSCHFYSGGGNNVKHGDLEAALLSCDRNTDVHMAANGSDMSCVACHTAENHEIKGKLYTVSSNNTNRATCQQCHTSTPHFNKTLNQHNSKVSCQACHIPTYAKVNPTKMSWKWSEAGRLNDGQPFHELDSLGKENYLSIKGKFTWEKDVTPDYLWFNGTANHYVIGDSITSVPVQVNTLNGSYDDVESKIYPVKIHLGDQIYDTELNRLIQPRLYADKKGDSAYWKDFDWDKAAYAGMNKIGLEYSGKHDFVETEMYWPINHMVAPKEQAVSCKECHTRNNGRLAKLTGFYLPGRDYSKALDFIGIMLIILSILGVTIHSIIRITWDVKNKRIEQENIDDEN